MTLSKLTSLYRVFSFIFFLCFVSCNSSEEKKEILNQDTLIQTSSLDNELGFVETLQTHLDAVSNRDLEALRSTLSPDMAMYLILPGSETTTTVNEFMEYHEAWFALPDWTFETKILHTQIGATMGMAITEIIYREPDRDGSPYFNRMTVSYDLQKIDGSWYVVKDQASSVEKSTDKK